MTLLNIFPWLVGLGSIIGAVLIHFSSKKKNADVQAQAAQDVAKAQAERDQAIVGVEQVRNAISKGNEAAAQESVQAAKERTNVDQATASAPRADNTQWMRDNGFIRDEPNEDVGRGAGSAGTDPHR